MRNVIHTLLFLFISSVAYSQVESRLKTAEISQQDTIRVSFQMVKGNGPFGYRGTLLSSFKDDPEDVLYGIDEEVNFNTTGYDDYIFTIGFLETNFLLNLFSKVQLGEVKPEALDRYSSYYDDMSESELKNLVKGPIDTQISMAILEKDGEKIIFVDTDNDNDLDDEVPQKVVTQMKDFKKSQLFSAIVQKVVSGEVINDKVFFDISTDPLLTVGVRIHFQGQIEIDGETKFIYAHANTNSVELKDDRLEMYVLDKPLTKIDGKSEFQELANQPLLKTGNTFNTSLGRYQILGVESGEILIKHLSDDLVLIGTQEGWQAPIIAGVDMTGKPIEFESGKLKYLDFWATWCPPCIEELPHLYDIYQFFNEEVELVSIADDKRERVVKFIDGRPIPWPTYLVEDMLDVLKDYEVTSYPTSFLLDTDNKVASNDRFMLRGTRALKTIVDELGLTKEQVSERINRGNIKFKINSDELLNSVMLRAEFSPDRQLPMYSYFNDEMQFERGVNIEIGHYFLEVAYVKAGDFKRHFKSLEIEVTGEEGQVIEIDLN